MLWGSLRTEFSADKYADASSGVTPYDFNLLMYDRAALAVSFLSSDVDAACSVATRSASTRLMAFFESFVSATPMRLGSPICVPYLCR